MFYFLFMYIRESEFIQPFINFYITCILIHALWHKKTILSNEMRLQKEFALDKLMESKSFWNGKDK